MSSITLTSAEETSELAARIATELVPGDVVLLEGDIGAGKTHFARSVIQTLLEVPEDVPSPTFTLVQMYDTPNAEIWHADLYRLTSPDEVVELGLIDAFEDAICLVEWPDRLSDLRPENALTMRFELGDDIGSRALSFLFDSDRWATVVRELQDG
ncbi:tRNA (adenosine(37)-N6)-threonylcarbamoyltransferase complex ATPase subunit type 1 TsaE [Shimia haliotis]|uniref:tRNA threonylcarbamoyladenosine biosynthesis protein TsaE n=1 Tax=Shimia haliotis TaxID=1280847 RepID=A0A1I4EIS2_9RHOB|nr:tRNA (adenosine(37)-N6)-threonylcarbamoyltransferase complex ATPase subunit type 1 TsaE [Shimia haliotis]SFL04346.1 tRNA threonylcarbamoyladenosine biosynthesis protein TsaE [Shimia haliotis]